MIYRVSPYSRIAAATSHTISSFLSMPVFKALGRKSVTTASICALTIAVGIESMDLTPTVFWAVTAVTALVPYTSKAENVLRSP